MLTILDASGTLLNLIPLPPIYLLLSAYIALLIYTIGRILLDTHSTSKTLAYILLVIVLPFIGIFFYYAVGINYRHHKSTLTGMKENTRFSEEYKQHVPDQTEELLKRYSEPLGIYKELVDFLYSIGGEKLSRNNYELLLNGERKYPEVLRALDKARYFIHMEYYAWENDIRGNEIKDVLIKKLKEGVKVRLIYDDYASRKIKKNIVKKLRQAGAEIHPIIKVKFTSLANTMNHRDHRKVIIIDGKVGFIGGINISDRYDNSIDTGLYWRDTHIKISGQTVHNLQRHFIINWNTCQPNKLSYSADLFPENEDDTINENSELAQIISGGPIYRLSTIMLSYFKIFNLAQKKLYITNPYFIPNDSILDALKQAALSGVDVRLLMPQKSDSAIVGAAAKFYYRELLQAGVKIYLYKKGFVHAKTVVADDKLSVVGTANMDIRSFDLNFEIFSVIYGENLAAELEKAFLDDLKESDEINYEDWRKQGIVTKLSYSIARLVSSFL